MDRPERWRESTVISQSEGQAGYNIAFDKWEAYHKQEMDKIKQSASEENIEKIIKKDREKHCLLIHSILAKAISEMIIGK